MKMHLALFSLFMPILLFGQTDFLITATGQKIDCHITSIDRMAGNIGKIYYLDKNEKEQTIAGKEVQTIYIDEHNLLLEYAPIKASKPDRYKRHLQVMAYGKIKVFYHSNIFVVTDRKGKRTVYYTETPTTIHIIQLNDDNYYDANKKKDLEGVVVPFLIHCNAVTEKYGNSIGSWNINEAAQLYNEKCGK